MDPRVSGKLNPARRFSGALWQHCRTGRLPVIPDIKARSPAEGDLLRGRQPVEYARTLAAAGAPVLSVVTEPRYFGGALQSLEMIAASIPLPVLRKDFIDHEDQLMESRDAGAAAVLLIAARLERRRLFKLIEAALGMGLEPLVEIHRPEEITGLRALGLSMLGINNRDINALEMDGGSVHTTERLAGLVPPGCLLISESSLSTPDDVRWASMAGAQAVLVGTALLQADDPAVMYKRLSEVRIGNL